MTAARRRAALDRARRQLDTRAPAVLGQLAANVGTEQPPTAQLPLFATAGGAYWRTWRKT